jgi:hypothetical protein
MKRTRRTLPRTVRDLGAAPIAAPSATARPGAATVCRTVTISADVDRIAADLERELRVSIDGEVVAVVAGRISR